MKVLKFSFDRYRAEEWLWLAISYFEAAEHLAREAEKIGHRGWIAPIIFNLRHGIELFLKSVMISSGTKIVDLTHDNHVLLNKVRSMLTEMDDASISIASRGLRCSPEEIRKYLHALARRIEGLTDKYTKYTFLPISVSDPKNELFRYPSNMEDGSHIDISGEADMIACNEMAKDAADLSSLGLCLLVMFSPDDAGQHLLDYMRQQESKMASQA